MDFLTTFSHLFRYFNGFFAVFLQSSFVTKQFFKNLAVLEALFWSVSLTFNEAYCFFSTMCSYFGDFCLFFFPRFPVRFLWLTCSFENTSCCCLFLAPKLLLNGSFQNQVCLLGWQGEHRYLSLVFCFFLS